MSFYYSVSGAIELDAAMSDQVQAIISLNEDKNPHVNSWLLHSDGGFSQFAFFGHTVSSSSMDTVRAQVIRIATEVATKDDEFTDYVTGLFRVTAESDERLSYVWRIENGAFNESVA